LNGTTRAFNPDEMVSLLREFHRAGGVKIQQGRQRRRAEKDLDRINQPEAGKQDIQDA